MLKLQLAKGDKVMIGEDTIIEVIATGKDFRFLYSTPVSDGVGGANTHFGDVMLHVLSTGKRSVQIGFEAPRSVKILRIPADITQFAKNAKRKARAT